MSILEIIHLRSSIEPVDALIEAIRESIWTEGHGSDVATLHRRRGLETDVAVHIRRRGESDGSDSSELAIHLAQALKVYGLVEHSVWEIDLPVNIKAKRGRIRSLFGDVPEHLGYDVLHERYVKPTGRDLGWLGIERIVHARKP